MLMPATAVLFTLLIPGHVPPPSPTIARVPLLEAALAQAPPLQRKRPDPFARSPVRASRRIGVIVIGAAIGAVVGGVVGYSATVDCNCDDPGYGALLGVPLGALGGGLIGATLVK